MKILVLATDYSDDKGHMSLEYIRTRNIAYKAAKEIDIDVLNFSSKRNYTLDGITVFSLDNFNKSLKNYDVVISHAPNVRNHVSFLSSRINEIQKIVYFFHGHEVLNVSKDYPKPYDYASLKTKLSHKIHLPYDILKFYKLEKLFETFDKKKIQQEFVFVSDWMLNKFKENLKYVPSENHLHIVPNFISQVFIDHNYAPADLEFDFITIRNNLDGPKYGVDLVAEMALKAPDKIFAIVGKGKFFDFNPQPKNIIYINRTLNHQEVIEYLNKSKVALMPTRLDSQGVMACEIASFGIPLITSDMDITREMLSDNQAVLFLSNDDFYLTETMEKALEGLQSDKNKYNQVTKDKFGFHKTIQSELNIIA